jgi:N4-gp56 family major capsid protein
MATGNFTVTTHDAFIPDIWSKQIIYTAEVKSILRGLVTTKYQGEIQAEGNTVKVPVISNVTVGDKSAGTAVTWTNYTESTVDIVINNHKYFAFRVDDMAAIQSSPDLIAPYATQGGIQIAKAVDTSLAALASAFSQSVGATSSAGAYTDITDAVIRNGIQLLDEANAPENDRFLIISPAQKNAMLGIDKFVDASKLGSDEVIRTGVFGKIYDVLVLVSNNLDDTASSSGGAKRKSCMMFQREALALAMQREVRVQSDYFLEYLAQGVVGDVLYGVKELVDLFGVEVRVTSEV